MNNKSNDGFLSFAVVGAAIILYARTADVLWYNAIVTVIEKGALFS